MRLNIPCQVTLGQEKAKHLWKDFTLWGLTLAEKKSERYPIWFRSYQLIIRHHHVTGGGKKQNFRMGHEVLTVFMVNWKEHLERWHRLCVDYFVNLFTQTQHYRLYCGLAAFHVIRSYNVTVDICCKLDHSAHLAILITLVTMQTNWEQDLSVLEILLSNEQQWPANGWRVSWSRPIWNHG